MFTRHAIHGGLRDFRSSGEWNPAAERIACLVSGNESGMIYQEGPHSTVPVPDSRVELVGEGSVGGTSESDRVTAPRVDLNNSRGNGGSYAW